MRLLSCLIVSVIAFVPANDAAITETTPAFNGTRFSKLDAMIGSGWGFSRLTLADMRRVEECSPKTTRNFGNANSTEEMQEQQEQHEDMDEMVKEIVETVLATQATTNQGRVIEYVDTTVQLEDNYEAHVSGVTLACFAFNNHFDTLDPSNNDTVGWAAYASHIVVSTTSFDGIFVPTERGPYAYNISMLMETDVLDLGATGVLFVPEQYCLDFVEGDKGVATTKPADDLIGGSASVGVRKSIDMGSKTNTLTFTQNRVPWIYRREERNDDYFKMVKAAYENPKAELIALIDVLTDPNATCATYGECMFLAYAGFEAKYPDLSFDLNTLEVTVFNYVWMNEQYNTFALAHEVLGESPGDRPVVFAAPFVFSKSLATTNKNGFFVNYANPYYTREELLDKIGLNKADTRIHEIEQCIVRNHDEHEDSASGIPTEALGAALKFEASLIRRLHEFDKTRMPRSNLSDWATMVNVGSLFHEEFDQPYLAQNVSWNENGELTAGNLTEKIMGKTADWIQVTDYEDSSLLQKLWEDHDQSSNEAFSRAASSAVDTSNPCSDAASNGEIYLLVFGMAVAACGGVNAVLHSVHIFFHWLYGANRAHISPPQTIWGRILPTYELFLVFVGTIIFVSLYIPTALQVYLELEVSEFESSQVDVVVDYGELDSERPITTGGKAVLVTFVYVETKCSDARPGLLIGLLVVGLVVGVLVNLPYAFLAWNACTRYILRLSQTEDDAPEGTTPQDKMLRLFEPGYVFANPSQSKSLVDDNDNEDIEMPGSTSKGTSATTIKEEVDEEDQPFLDAVEDVEDHRVEEEATPKDEAEPTDTLVDEDELVQRA